MQGSIGSMMYFYGIKHWICIFYAIYLHYYSSDGLNWAIDANGLWRLKRISCLDYKLNSYPFYYLYCLTQYILEVIRMKFGMRKPSLKKSIVARTSVKRYIRHSLGAKTPRGWGWITNPQKALYNKVYNKTTFSIFDIFKLFKR